MLSYEDFIAKATAGIDQGDFPPKRLKIDEPVFFASWQTGGVEGGNCWGTGTHYALSAEKEPDLTPLMELLNGLDLRLNEANAILGEVTEGTYEEGGYYGNYSSQAYKCVSLAVVHEKLVEFGYVEPKPDAPAP